jgi:hypothetical protein
LLADFSKNIFSFSQGAIARENWNKRKLRLCGKPKKEYIG